MTTNDHDQVRSTDTHRPDGSGEPGAIYECQDCNTFTLNAETCPECGSTNLERVPEPDGGGPMRTNYKWWREYQSSMTVPVEVDIPREAAEIALHKGGPERIECFFLEMFDLDFTFTVDGDPLDEYLDK